MISKQKKLFALMAATIFCLAFIAGCFPDRNPPGDTSTPVTFNLARIESDGNVYHASNASGFSDIVTAYGNKIDVKNESMSFNGTNTSPYNACGYNVSATNVEFSNEHVRNMFKAFTYSMDKKEIKATVNLISGTGTAILIYHNSENLPNVDLRAKTFTPQSFYSLVDGSYTFIIENLSQYFENATVDTTYSADKGTVTGRRFELAVTEESNVPVSITATEGSKSATLSFTLAIIDPSSTALGAAVYTPNSSYLKDNTFTLDFTDLFRNYDASTAFTANVGSISGKTFTYVMSTVGAILVKITATKGAESAILSFTLNVIEGATADQHMTLEIWAGDEYMVPATNDKFKEFISKFNASAAASRLKVTLTFKAMTSVNTSLSTALIANQAPDLVIWDRFFTASNSHLLTPLDSMISETSQDPYYISDGFSEKYKNLNKEALDELTYKNTVYGIPIDLDPWGIYVNLDIVNQYNAQNPGATIDVNKLDTWSRLKAAAEKLTVRNGSTVTRAGLNTTSMDGHFFSYGFTAGGEIINTGRGAASYTSQYGDSVLTAPPDEYGNRVRETLAFFLDLYKSNICSTTLGGTDAFVEGKTVMTYGSMFFPQTMKAYSASLAANMNYKFIPYPKRDLSYFTNGGKAPTSTENGAPVIVDSEEVVGGLKNGVFGGMLGGYGLAIPYPQQEAHRNAEWQARRDRAWMVIREIIFNDLINEMLFTTTEQITARTDLHNHTLYTADTKNNVMKQALVNMSSHFMRPNVAGYESFESSAVRTEIQKLYEGTHSTVTTCYMQIMSEGNTILRRAQGRPLSG